MDSRYAGQIFCVFATALVYTLLAVAAWKSRQSKRFTVSQGYSVESLRKTVYM